MRDEGRLADSGDESGELARKLAIVAFIRVLIVTVSFGALFILIQSRPGRGEGEIRTWHYALIGAAYGLSFVYAVALRYRWGVLPLAYAQIVLDTLMVSVLVSMTGGIESVFTFVYVFTVLGASTTLYRRGAVVATISYVLMLGTVVLLQVDDEVRLLASVDFGRAMFSFFMYSLGIGLVAFLSSALAEKAKITGRRLAEKQSDYARLEELHAVILRSLPAGLMTIDEMGFVRFANEAALLILRRSRESTIGAALADVVPCMARELECARPMEMGNEATRERFEGSFVREDGRSIRIGFSFAPLGGGGGAKGSIAVFQDVTELVRLKDAYERAERLATVGKLAAGLAHEVRNPLASICASIDVIKGSLEPPEPMKRLMANVVKEADRLNALITDFLAFARPRELQIKTVDLSTVVASVVDVLKNDQLFRSCKLDLSLESGLRASIDADQIRQVVWNLARNAAEAMATPSRSSTGVLSVKTRSRAQFAEILIRDTGPGIPPEHMKRIFDPFYTTKPRGSGLGLAITHSIVEAHGGRILLESRPGEGTEALVSLPQEGAPRADLAHVAQGLETNAVMRNEM